MAEKTAKTVGRPVPDLRGTLTKIMNVVWIDDAVAYEKKRHRVKVQVYNYTPKQQRFKIHTVLPKGCLDLASCSLRPSEVKEREGYLGAAEDRLHDPV